MQPVHAVQQVVQSLLPRSHGEPADQGEPAGPAGSGEPAEPAQEAEPAARAELPARTMELYLLLYPKEVEAEVLDTLEACGVPGYTEFPRLLGRGRRQKHFDNPVWPGMVGAVFTVISSDQAAHLVQPFQALNDKLDARTNGLHGLHLFALPCRQLI